MRRKAFIYFQTVLSHALADKPVRLYLEGAMRACIFRFTQLKFMGFLPSENTSFGNSITQITILPIYFLKLHTVLRVGITI